MEHSSTKVTEKVNSNSFHRKHGMRIGKKFAGFLSVSNPQVPKSPKLLLLLTKRDSGKKSSSSTQQQQQIPMEWSKEQYSQQMKEWHNREMTNQ